jgi:hypothetical protein
MQINDFKQVITKHLNRLINEWFSDMPLIQAFAKTIIKANINKYDNYLNLLTDENGDIMIEDLLTNLNLKDGYEIDLTRISPLLPSRVLIISKQDIDAIIDDINRQKLHI